jgi:hypothetical protein
MSNELESTWKESCRSLSDGTKHLPRRTKENHWNLSHGSNNPDQDSNWVPPKHNSEAEPLEPASWACVFEGSAE